MYGSLEHNGDGAFKNLGGINATLEVKFVVNVCCCQCLCTTHVVMKITFWGHGLFPPYLNATHCNHSHDEFCQFFLHLSSVAGI